MEGSESLSESIELYKLQLSQITETLKVTPDGNVRDNLLSLKSDVEELLKLTQDSIDKLHQSQVAVQPKELPDDDPFSKEYALFKAELESLDSKASVENIVVEQETSAGNAETEEVEEEICLQEELQSLIGSKCRAPYTNKSGSCTYYNALISGVEIAETLSEVDHIKVRVLFINPTEKKMIPCPYFLDDKCKFNEEDCNFSHGNVILFDQLREYVEPNFTLLKPGCRVLAKLPNLPTWISTIIEDIVKNDTCVIKHERTFVEIPMHDVLPPLDYNSDGNASINNVADNDEEEDDYSRSIDNTKDVDIILAQKKHHDDMVELSLNRDSPGGKLGQWEEHTKGIGSKLMAKMGYIVGTGLGKNGEGILKPVEPVILPAGKSLDHCMNLKEASGGSNNLLTVEKMQKKLAAKVIAQSKRQYLKSKKPKKDLFYIINSSICTAPSTSTKHNIKGITKNLNTISDRQLNVERFKLSECIKQSERNIMMLERSIRSIDDHKGDKILHKNVSAKLESQQRELLALKRSDNKLESEQVRRNTKRKMTLF